MIGVSSGRRKRGCLRRRMKAEAAVILVDGEPTAAVRRSEAKVFQAALPELEPPRLKFTGLDVYAPFPDRSQLLLLSFRTPVEPIADSMMILFEAIAGSLRRLKS